MTAVKKIEEQEYLSATRAITPMEMISHAVSNGGDVSVIEKLMTLEERWQKTQGRREFDQAISDAKAEIPVIHKNRTGHNSKYADFAAYARVVDPILSKHGLSYRFRTKQDNAIEVTCILSHCAGHSEESTLRGPEDKSGSKNAIQAIGSTLTYLQRYTLVQALGLAASDDDDGKGADQAKFIDDAQLTQLEEALTGPGQDVHAFMKHWKISTLSDLPAASFKTAMQQIAMRAKGGANHG